ncbi:MAG: esterase [Eubacterium sp.]|nr:esterase [Eubacterium sp.]
MKVFELGGDKSDLILIQMVDSHSIRMIESEAELIRKLSGRDDFRLVACQVDDWNQDLSPWEAPPVFGKEGFGGKAEKTLQDLKESVLSRCGQADRKFIGGYSLAGLFALWAAYREDSFEGVAAASPSVWFPGFVDMAERERILTKKVYLSLGDKEEKAKNPVMATVGDSIRRLHQIYEESNGIETALEWNEGNHFREPELRMAKGFAWAMKEG